METQRLDEKPFMERVVAGNANAEKVIDCLNKHYPHLFHFEPATKEEDIHDKIDYFEVSRGNRIPTQVKCNDPTRAGDDILAALYEPWKGTVETSEVARDKKSAYQLYVNRSRGAEIRVIVGQAMKAVLQTVEDEWVAQGCSFMVAKRNRKTGHVEKYWRSEIIPGVELWQHVDSKNKRVKIVAYVPPSVFSKKDIFKLRYKQ